ARRVLDAAITELREAVPDGGGEPQEIPMLEGMRDVLQPQLPTSQRYELERRLQAALTAENYELAAILRDELRQLP
ncbi:MAG: UvrB/UvrC motif-containing protein, partial [Planctomycetota bacterium]|nr:UvrB/UvrC motif-containing protein [Planctomycetota bacterium]